MSLQSEEEASHGFYINLHLLHKIRWDHYTPGSPDRPVRVNLITLDRFGSCNYYTRMVYYIYD